MSTSTDRLSGEYTAALLDFLASSSLDETKLGQAYELGRKALELGAGVLEVTATHTRALSQVKEGSQVLAAQFLSEALAPFEMALRGYREANTSLQQMKAALEQRVAERTGDLRKAEVKFRSLVEQLPAITYVTELTGARRLTYVSPQVERILGYSSAQWIADGFWSSRLHDEDRSRVLRELQNSTGRFAAEYRLLANDGRVVWVSDEVVVVTNEEGQPLYRQGILVDLTSRRQLEEQFRQSQKMEVVGLLAGGVAHDFNNLLTVILSCADLVKMSLGPDHACSEDLGEIINAGERAASLTRQLLSLGRRQVLALEPLQLNSVVSNTEKMLRRLIGENIDLDVQLPETAGTIRADRGQIEQVILNLVVNARDAMPNGGKLTIETSEAELDGEVSGAMGAPAGRYVMLAVSDTGLGMDDLTRARIFEPFFTTKPVGKGTGLGLSTVFGIVKENAGELYVYSAPNLGTTFRVYLPAAEAQAPLEASTAPMTGTETLLVVDDEQAVRAIACRVLRGAGYQVLEAATPEEALLLSDGHAGIIHLVVTDIVMPQMNGHELAEKLSRRRPAMRLLFMSGYTGGALTRQRLLEPGMTCVQKPFTPSLLLRKVRTVLDAGTVARK
jgi:two-component system cell cycle sensor histidine kinase/response regulator CckA